MLWQRHSGGECRDMGIEDVELIVILGLFLIAAVVLFRD